MELALNNFEVLDQTQMQEIDGGAYNVVDFAKACIGGAVSGGYSVYCETGSIGKAVKGAVIGFGAGGLAYLICCW